MHIEMEFKVRNTNNYSDITTTDDPIRITARLQFGQVKSINDYVEVDDEM